MSVLYVTIADFRGTDFSLSVRDKTLNTFHYKWEEASIDDGNKELFFSSIIDKGKFNFKK